MFRMSVAEAHVPGASELRRGTATIPPLESGDRMTRAEFERRYANMPALKKAELINGIVIMGSPVRYMQHGRPHATAVGWLVYYTGRTPEAELADNTTLRLDEENEPQPDLLLRIPRDRGGTSWGEPDGYLRGPVELIVEIAASSVSVDAHDKLDAYRRNSVPEYLLWRTDDAAVDWFVLRDGRYEPIAVSTDGFLKSQTFHGLWLDPAALLRGDLPRLFAVLDQGTATPEHAAFVDRLRPRA
jgi:hypothetical protein